MSLLNDSDYIVLKSNAYGFGFIEILQIAISCGLYKFIVIEINDAVKIKQYYPNTRVLLLPPINPHYLLLCEKFKIEVAVDNLEDIKYIVGYKITVQIAINSGMNRFGIRIHELDEMIRLLEEENIEVSGIYSHNATKIPNIIASQLNLFYKVVQKKEDIDIHFSSSSLKDYVITGQRGRRIGEFIYRDSLTVYGKIIKVNHVSKGEYVGYDFAYRMEKDGFVGIIDLGYANGLERKCNGFNVWVKDKYYRLIGNACMNNCFILLEDDYLLNKNVCIIGKNNKIDNYASYFGKINHEIYLSFLKKF